jgi:hypothetical protein
MQSPRRDDRNTGLQKRYFASVCLPVCAFYFHEQRQLVRYSLFLLCFITSDYGAVVLSSEGLLY